MCSVTVALVYLIWAGLDCLVFNYKKYTGCFTPEVKWISLRLKEMQIHASTVERAAQTNISAVLPFRIAETW